MIYDLIIIGLGPAGISAAIYAKRSGLNVLCLDKSMPGGELNFIDRIDNYPGFYDITGPDLALKMFDQFNKYNIEFKNKNVLDIIVEDDYKRIVTNNEEFLCKKVIIATGRVSMKLGLEHEDELIGKGISYCALCDGNLFKDRDVCVVGNSYIALKEALYLSNIVNKVYLVCKGSKFRANDEIVKKIKNQHNVEILFNTKITELCVDECKLSALVLNNDTKIEVACLFSYVGYVPGTKFKTDLNIFDDNGYVIVNDKYMTNEDGIYAIGDIIRKDVYQIVTAVSEGAIAATDICEKLK